MDTNFESIFQAINIPCLALKPEGGHFRIIAANDAYSKITGSALEDLQGKTTCEAFPSNPAADYYGADILLESFRKVAMKKENDQMDVLRYDIPVRGTGEFLEKYWSFQNVPALSKDGELEYVLHMVRDVTGQVLTELEDKRMNLELEKNRQQFNHFVEANTDGLYSLDREGKFLTANQGLADIAAVSLEDLLQMDFLPFCLAEDRDYTLEQFSRAINGEATKFEARFVSANGRDMILEVSLGPMMVNGQIIGAYGIVKDLTNLRNSEKLIVRKRNFLQANAAFISSLLQGELNINSLREPLGLIGEALGVDRIFYYGSQPTSEAGKPLLYQIMEWKKAQPELQVQVTGQEPLLIRLEEVTGKLYRNQPFIVNFSELQEGVLKEKLRLQMAKALILLPVLVQEQLYGVIGINDCTRERQWSLEEVDFLKTLAANLSSDFEKRAARIALKKQENALRLSEQKFKALVQGGSDMFAILDLEGNYSFVSDTTTAVLGIEPWEITGRNASEFIHPDDQERIMEQFRSLEIFKQSKLAPYRFRNKKGEWRWLQTTLTNMTEDPAVQGMVGNSSDITRIIEQEQEIQKINEGYQLAALATQDLIYDWDLITDKVTRFHKDRSEFLGHPIEKVDRREFWRSHMHPQELTTLHEQQEATLADPTKNFVQDEYRFQRADGSYADIIDRAYIIRNHQGKAVRLVGATSDVSDLKAKEAALKAANKRFKLAMKATKEVIWDWDLATDKIERSKTFEKISGFELKKGSEQLDFWVVKIHPEDRERVSSSLRTAVGDKSGHKWREEYRMIKANGEIAYLVDRGFIVRDQEGKAIRMVGSALDATESRTAMKHIKHQNALLREIAWDQSHLVRAPLVRLKGLLDLLEMEETIEEMSREEILQHLQSSADELDDIVKAIVKKSEMIEPVEGAGSVK